MSSQTLQNHYNEILHFLRAYRACWDQEILHGYPNSINRPPQSWMQDLADLSHEQLWQVDAKLSFNSLTNHDMKECFTQLENLTLLPIRKIDQSHSFNVADAFFGVRGKKRHEIEILAPILRQLHQAGDFKHVIDVGGGQGHLSRIISKHFGVAAISLDRDPKLLAQGQKNVDRLRHRLKPPGAQEITFEECNISAQTPCPACFDAQSFVLGLHTCGDLAWHLMRHSLSANCQGILSFGCCYNKMEMNQHGHAKYGPPELELDRHALTLATRGHKSDSRQAFDLKVQVKRHRYSLHLFHYHQRQSTHFIPMGETVAREYLGSFSQYALPRLQAYGLDASEQELDDFYELEWVQDSFKKMLHANLIRWQFGRAVELAILLDRAIKLEKGGMKVELATYFNERKSPRNIGILAQR